MESQPKAKSIYNQTNLLFISAVTHSALYSFSIALFIACLIVQRYQVNKKDPSHHLITLCLWILFTITTIQAIVHTHFYRLVLVVHADNPGYAGILNTAPHIISNLLEGVGAAVADCLLIWRCYVLWARRRAIIAVPSILTLATFATSIVFAVQYAKNNPDGILKTSLVVVSLSVATNIIVTILIASRIIIYLRETTMPDEDRKPYMTIIGIIIESAALYAASGIVLTVTNALGHPSEQVAVSIYMLIPSIAAYMVVLRVGLGLQFGFAEGQDSRDATGRTRGRRQRVPGTGTGIQFDHGTFDLRSRGAKSTAYGSGSGSGTESGTGTGSVSVSGEGQPMVHVVSMDIEKGEKVAAAGVGAGMGVGVGGTNL